MENAVEVVVLISLKHNGLCWGAISSLNCDRCIAPVKKKSWQFLQFMALARIIKSSLSPVSALSTNGKYFYPIKLIFRMVKNEMEWKPAFRLTKRCLVYPKNKQTKKSTQCSVGGSMTTRSTRGSNEGLGRKKRRTHWQIQIISRGSNNVPEFWCTRNAVCVHVTYTVVTVHVICEGLIATAKLIFLVLNTLI